MEKKDYTKEKNYIRAKKKVEALKGFYWHFAIYIIINAFITVNKVIRNVLENGESYSEALWDINIFFIWVPWGLGVLIHGLVVFDVFSFVLGKNWQERKIKKYMDDENNREEELTTEQDLWE